MRYIVVPVRKKNGCCRSVCNTQEQAESEKKKLEVLTGKEWCIIEKP